MSNTNFSDGEIYKKHNELKKIKQKKERLLHQINRENEKKRKERAHRLIQKGALLEKYFEADNLSISETEELLKMFSDFVVSKKPDHLKK
ncbi:DUF3847 domain-containing protein [Bacillus sonorensis]|uniref:DUF3847 domain-containing protein n=1 Tax=Bacillus subtilis group TaxID=653685 RepID=UPI001FD71E92|nr:MULTISPECIES: DUF3847 domain-containing protein [Bacillus subtilis group]MCJ8223737.1 DUF3847 domain-containing protein [Bacillus paralicheniformis]MEC0526200.1 DUF3847 domain-containing protein [Bacillus sonorensis]